MKEFPILFSAPMVRAILDGTKTQTRRVVKPQPHILAGELLCWKDDALTDDQMAALCPYGQPGDRLWVRQEHYRFGHWEPVPGVRTKGNRQKWKFVADTDETLYEAPDEYRKGRHHKDPATPAWHKRMARFMPRRLSAIELEITGVRVERLQDISEADAIAEGTPAGFWEYDHGEGTQTAKESYECLWESINGPESWQANPLVWVVEFKRLDFAPPNPQPSGD